MPAKPETAYLLPLPFVARDVGVTGISEDRRKRSDGAGRFLYTCGTCGRMFWHKLKLASAAGPRISVCGAVLDPPEPRCLMQDDDGTIWWPKDKPMPDLLEIDRRNREARSGD